MSVTKHYKTITIPDVAAFIELQFAMRCYIAKLSRNLDPANDTAGLHEERLNDARRAMAAIEAAAS